MTLYDAATAATSTRVRPTLPTPSAPDERPDARLRWLTALLGLGLSAVPFRLADVRSDIDIEASTGPRAVRSVEEPIPARDGRILSSDGSVLAEDVETFAVLVHYRWIERPANPQWLRREALRSLKPSERRDPALVTEAERRVERRRQALWSSLTRLSGAEADEMFRRFAATQDRVARLRRSLAQPRPDVEGGSTDIATTWWQAAWRLLAEAVTTPPRRESDEPLVLAEETQYHAVASGLPLAAAARVEADPESFPGTRVRVESRRRYPNGNLAAHAIGYRFSRTDDPGTVGGFGDVTTGQSGVERTYDRHLRGIPGVRRIRFDRRGDVVRSETIREPRVGRDIVLHLHAALQQDIENALDQAIERTKSQSPPATPMPKSAGGVIALIDVRTGAILAAASAPRFDLGAAAARRPAFWRDATADGAKPLFDRVASAALPPGSVFKIVSSVALLESGRIDPDEPTDCVGYLERPERHRDYIYTHFGTGHGPTTLSTALAQSCNVYFFRAARKIGSVPLVDWASRFGYGRPTGADLPGESSGHLSSAGRNADALGLSIGQADLTASPLQVLRMTAAVANGGRLVTPHLVRGSGPARQDDDPAKPLLSAERIDGLNEDTLPRVREGLERVVSHPQGSGYKTVRHPGIAIAGKTGTAESGGGRPDHAWFTGYAPADDPQVAFVVLLEHAGSGGQAAGPLARAAVDALLKHGLVRP